MLTLTDHGCGVFSIKETAFKLRSLGAESDLSPWEPGQRVCGWHDQTVLSDGTPDDSFLGFPLVAEWDNREGYTLLPWREFRLSLYSVSEFSPIFVGAPTPRVLIYSADMECAQVAVPTESLIPGYDRRQVRHEFFAPMDAFAKLMANGSLPPYRRCDPSSDHVSFAPTEPLSRADWFNLGFWITTEDEATVDQVTTLITGDDVTKCVSIVAPSLKRIAESGITTQRLVGVRADSPAAVGAYQFESFIVTDPSRASELWPPAAHVYPRTSIEPATEYADTFCVTAEGLAALENLSETAYYEDAKQAFVIPVRDIRLRPGRHLKALYERCLPAYWFFTREDAAHMVPVATASATYGEPVAHKMDYVVFAEGRKLSGFYCAPEELAAIPTETERLAQLETQHGRKMPKGWQYCLDNIPAFLEFADREAEGWLPLYEIACNLGIDPSAKALEQWVRHLNLPAAQHPYQGTRIYAPISFDSLVEHPDFSAFLNVVFGQSAEFARRCIRDERTRISTAPQE